jgi:flagellar biosynthetic protein FlhB
MAEKGTEQATAQRKKKAREDGDVVRSRELLSAVAMLAGVLALGAVSRGFVVAWGRIYVECLGAVATGEVSSETVIDALRRTLAPAALPIAVVMGAAFLGALGTGIAQGGGLGLHPKAIALKFNKLNPVTNLGNLFSLRSAARLSKSLVPAGVMTLFGWNALRGLMLGSPALSTYRLSAMFLVAYRLILDAAWVSLVWSALDYVVEWRSWSERLKMTKQEMREEMKEAGGNPQIKGRIRQIQRAMRRRKVKADMSRASVVVTNPTHYAVALEFNFETMQAPTVLAKGRDLQAAEIREAARWAGVPTIENPALARSLYRAVEPGQSIPFELYQAVAGILAFLYRQRVEERMRREREAERLAQQRAAARSGGGAQSLGGTQTSGGAGWTDPLHGFGGGM